MHNYVGYICIIVWTTYASHGLHMHNYMGYICTIIWTTNASFVGYICIIIYIQNSRGAHIHTPAEGRYMSEGK